MNHKFQKTTLKIVGTRCPSCELFISDAFRSLPGIERVSVNHRNGLAEVWHSSPLRLNDLEKAVAGQGYEVLQRDGESTSAPHRNSSRDYLEIGLAAVAVAAIFGILKAFDLVPNNFGVSESMSYWMVLGLGAVAAVSTCIATTGGLLLAVSARYAEKYPFETGLAKFSTHIYFNLGRLASYGFFGAIIGAVGSSFVISPFVNGILVVSVSLVMVALGLKMLKLMPSLGLSIVPSSAVEALYDFGKKKSGSFVAGVLTFFLPCGFTQALQVYVLSVGGAVTGAMTMFVFALGTLPSLMTLGAFASFGDGGFKRYFLKMAGVAIVIFGLTNIGNGLNLAGFSFGGASAVLSLSDNPDFLSSKAEVVDGRQVVRMKVVGLDYEPSQFTVRAGQPVEWLIDGSGALGCARTLVVPKLGLTEVLQKNKIKKITFTPQKVGKISFSCSMGMTTPGAAFNVVK